jgi:putative transposase
MKAVCKTLGVARSNIAARATGFPSRARGRPPLPDRELVEDIKAVIADTPTYGYRRVHAILRRNARKPGRSWPNAKRVYRVMKLHNLLLVRHTGPVDDRLHDGQVAVERSNIRWCSDGFEIGCDNKEKVRVAFALDCCDREAIAHVATTEGIKSQDVQDLVITAVENRASICYPSPSNGSPTTAPASSPGTPHPCSATSAWNLARHRCEAHSRTAWPRRSSKHSSAITSR